MIPKAINDYFQQISPDAREILLAIREKILERVKDATEKISYGMPSFHRNGILIYYAAFKKHIGIFPPIKGDDQLMTRLEPFLGPKGNLQFPLNQKIDFELLELVIDAQIAANIARQNAKPNRGKMHSKSS